jgi:dynein heavy chain 2
MQGVLLILGENDSSWTAIKKILGQDGFCNRIMRFDPKSVTPDCVTKVEKLLKQKAQSFEDDVISKASRAVAPLAKWVKALVRFAGVHDRVKPLERELEAAGKEIAKKRAALNELREKKELC